MRSVLVLAVLVTSIRADLAEATCRYRKYRHSYEANDGLNHFANGTQQCKSCGIPAAGECDGIPNPPLCSTLLRIYYDVYECADDAYLFPNAEEGPFCPCSASSMSEAQVPFLQAHPDGELEPLSYQCGGCGGVCTANESDELQKRCSGRECLLQGRVGEACGDDEYSCTKSHGVDGFPVNLSSGRVETRPITLYSYPTPEGIEFDFTIKYDSHASSTPARKRTIPGFADTVPTIHHADERTHSVGRNWLDSFGDRLVISAFGLDSTVKTWIGMNGIVTFTNGGAGWKSTGGKFELIDRGASQQLRWVIKSTDTSAPRRTWAFEQKSYTTLDQHTEVYGRLGRRSLTTGADDVDGFYGYTINWNTDGTILDVTDTIGRQLTFQYASWPSTAGEFRTVVGVSVRHTDLNSAVYPVATLTQADNGQLLDRIEPVGVGSYKRFLYAPAGRLLTDVIVPISGTTPGLQAPLGTNEVVLEHHVYETPFIVESQRPRAIESGGPGRQFAYEWDDENRSAVQYDLKQPRGLCSAGCATGEACKAGTCYVAQQIKWSGDSGEPERLPTRNHPFGAPSSLGSGNPMSLDMTYSSPSGAPARATDPSAMKTTNGYDSSGRLRCIVRKDNDDEAFAADGSCSGPADAQIIRVDYTPTTITKTTPSLLGAGNVTEVQSLDSDQSRCSPPELLGGTLFPCTIATTGTTHDINGTISVITPTSTRAYDAIGRVIEANGPLDDEQQALDKTTTAYYAYNESWPHNIGRVELVKRYVGTTAGGYTELTTTYAEYDVFGVPHRITGPNGDQVTYSPSADRLTWTITQIGVGGGTIGSSVVRLNGDGTVRSMQDADGVCMTYEYKDATGYVGAPTVIQRYAWTCGTVPININQGEVEIRTYVNGDASRLASVQRRNSGAVELSYSGFTYDRDRRLTNATTLDSALPFTFGFADVLPNSTVAPGAPAAGSWRTDTIADDFGRPKQLLRFITATDKQAYTYLYDKPFSPRPTQMKRGLIGAETSITYFVYDDFGRLVETTVPEAGAPNAPAPTRYEYDAAGRMTKKRIGVNTAAVRTSAYSYDSLGRTTFVDHDTEHPVNCASAPDGTPIQDEEYRYDNCTGDVPTGFACNNALGKLTISRAVVQCSSGAIVKRGRWYDYDSAGRMSRVAYAVVSGSTILTPSISTKGYTAAGRMSSSTSPAASVYGTSYTFDTNGHPTTISTSAGTLIAYAASYRAFGPLRTLSTESVQPVGSGSRRLKLTNTYRSDNSLQMLDWTMVGTGGASSIAVLKDEMTYGPAGLLSLRRDLADNLSSRFYNYDPLLRMTCEARGSGSTVPSISDCATSSTRLAGFYSYGDGQSATQPPDVRLTSYIKGAGTAGATYTSPSSSGETYTYLNGSGQTQQINRTGSSNIVLEYDALGRRTADYDSASLTFSRRDYTYLPNGQLGTITGYDQSNQPYSFAIRYDAEGRPETMTSSANSYTLTWDDDNRLIVARITAGITNVTWHYHYLGATLVAATRVYTQHPAIPPTVKRYWAVTDERGLLYRLQDEQGLTGW